MNLLHHTQPTEEKATLLLHGKVTGPEKERSSIINKVYTHRCKAGWCMPAAQRRYPQTPREEPTNELA